MVIRQKSEFQNGGNKKTKHAKSSGRWTIRPPPPSHLLKKSLMENLIFCAVLASDETWFYFNISSKMCSDDIINPKPLLSSVVLIGNSTQHVWSYGLLLYCYVTSAQVFSCEICKIFKNAFLYLIGKKVGKK